MPARVGAQRWHPAADRGRRREVLEQRHWVLPAFLRSAARTVAAVGGHERTAVRSAATLTRSCRSRGQRAPQTGRIVREDAGHAPCAGGVCEGGARAAPAWTGCARLARGVRRRD